MTYLSPMARQRAHDRYIRSQNYQIKFWREYMNQCLEINETMAELGIDSADPRRKAINHEANNAGFACYYHTHNLPYTYPEFKPE